MTDDPAAAFEVKSICGAVKLTCAIFGLNPEEELARMKLIPLCPMCQKKRATNRPDGLCLDCQAQARTIMLVCDQCGRLFPRRSFQVMHSAKQGYEHHFCGRSCHGRYAAARYGFAVHPENCGRNGGRKPLYDHEAIWQAHLDTGYGCVRLSRRLNLPNAVVSYVLRKHRG